jgi:hypothetical protein
VKLELLLSVWGSVTGTVAIASTIRQWFHDRARVKVTAALSIEHRDIQAVVIKVAAVNLGRRPVRIKNVCISLD